MSFAFSPGFLYRNRDESFIYDTRVAYSTEKIVPITGIFIDDGGDHSNDYTLGDEVSLPVFWENTFTFAFNKRNTFFVIKQLNDLCIDRTYYFGRLLPAIEHFPLNWFSLRAGLEGSYAVFNDSSNTGFGAMGGITFRVKNWGLDFDLNFTYRKRPSRVIEGVMFTDYIILLSGTLSDVFISRK